MTGQTSNEAAETAQRIEKLEGDILRLQKALMETMPALTVDRLEFPVHERVLTQADTGTDLGRLLAPLVAAHHSLQVTFDLAGVDGPLTFTWNEPIRLPATHTLSINSPHANNTQNGDELRVHIKMTQSRASNHPRHPDTRIPGRVYVGRDARLILAGLNILESACDARAPAPSDSRGQALFSIEDDGGAVELSQSHITTSEDVIGFGTRVFGRVKFGHTYFHKHPNSPRDILAVKRGTGWSFAGAGGVVSSSHTHLDPGVSFQDTPAILYI